MASDLIAHHYLHTAPSHISHPTPKPFLATPIPPSHFTLYTAASNETVERVWLILHGETDIPNPSEQMYALLATPPLAGNHRKLMVNTYDKRIVQWAIGIGNRAMRVDLLYEMVLTPGGIKEQRVVKGYKLGRGESWFVGEFPAMAGIVSVGGEEVWVVTTDGREGGEEVVSWMTVVRGQDGRKSYVSTLETKEGYRRLGLARMLLAGFLKGEKEEVWITVFCANWVAVEMYVKLGWRTKRCLWAVGHGGGEV
ncbi:unnamed protein product [Tuber melanosporum]|uniref:(Perigord truffle) hypothetical protein n=1 Tax=Tuber melanosporum (strain Mel28) TaxID=656061 RepID=D5GET2_TUBMM|nr:uncharacterized protein GSTUM_00001358001 [Tuber melanosporum]CAZ83025.1 unnamed protein product [Tuber melanosporum]